VIAESFAEIFFGNSVTLGMPCVTISRPDRIHLSEMIEANPTLDIVIDLEKGEVRAADKTFKCEIKDSARLALTSGRWDPLSELMGNADQVHSTARKLTYVGD
jgi:3-isopropylmalate/(R)-2-methylmalate dehydratase small subunit